MQKYYRIIDTAPSVAENVGILVKMGAVHYRTITSSNGTYRNFVLRLDENELLIAKLSLINVSIDPLSDEMYDSLKNSGYIT